MSLVKNDRGEEFEVDDDCMLVDGVLIKVALDDIISLDLEGFLDRISEDAGFPLLMQQTVEIEGYEGRDILLRVRGDVSMCIDSDVEFDHSTWPSSDLGKDENVYTADGGSRDERLRTTD